MNRNKVVSSQWTVDSEEWTVERAENHAPAAPRSICNLQFAIFNLQSPPSRRGISLLEVLISIGVLAVGLLGVIAIIPLGQMTIAEAIKADRAGACGRAVMRDIKVKRMLDYRSWFWDTNYWGLGYNGTNTPDIIPNLTSNYIIDPEANGSFMIDPFGRAKNLPSILYGIQSSAAYLPRRTLTNPGDFYWPDDFTLATPENPVERPFIDSAVGLDNYRSIDYSYLFTASPSSSERLLPIPKRRLFDVTVAVFFQRNIKVDANGYPEGEWVADVSSISGLNPGDVSPGGGTIALGTTAGSDYNFFAYRINGTANNGCAAPLNISTALPAVRENQWVMLWDRADGRLAWYRVIGVNFPDTPTSSNPPTLTLDGPDWVVSQNHTEKLIIIDGAIGTYTSTVELDYDPLWQGM